MSSSEDSTRRGDAGDRWPEWRSGGDEQAAGTTSGASTPQTAADGCAASAAHLADAGDRRAAVGDGGRRRAHRRLSARRHPAGQSAASTRRATSTSTRTAASSPATARSTGRTSRVARSPDVQHAVLAAEDRDFYTESAIDPKAMIRAAWNTATGKGKQSGSTITQQYVKNYYLGQEQTVTRKVKEFFISIKLDREKSKDRDPRGLPQHQLLRPQRLRHPGRRAGVLRHRRRGADGRPGRLPRRAAQRPSEYDVIAHPENRPRRSPAGTTSSTAWSRRAG